MTADLFPGRGRVTVRAHFLAERLEAGRVEGLDGSARRAGIVRLPEGCAVLFRYGAVVTFGLSAAAEEAFLDDVVRPALPGPVRPLEREEAELVVGADREGTGTDGAILVADSTPERLVVVAEVLARSTVLAHYEGRVADAFDRIEPLAEDIRRGRRPGSREPDLLRHLGEALLVQTRTVGRVEVLEKPDATWDRPDLDRLFERLRAEYELIERDRALSRKVDLISRITGTLIDLVQERRTLRVEWYIVILILVEIVLVVYQLLVAE